MAARTLGPTPAISADGRAAGGQSIASNSLGRGIRKAIAAAGVAVRRDLRPPRWAGFTVLGLEWGVTAGRAALAAAFLIAPFVVAALRPVRPALLVAGVALALMTPALAWLLVRRGPRVAVAAGAISDTVIISGLAVASGWLLDADGLRARDSVFVLSGLPLALLIVITAFRLRPLPGGIYAIGLPAVLAAIAAGLGASLPARLGVDVQVAALTGIGLVIAAMAYPVQRTQAAVEEAARAKLEIVAAVAHELQGPMTSVRAYVALLLDGSAGTLTNDQRSLLERAARSVLRLEHTSALFMQVDRAEDQGARITTAPVDLAKTARRVIEALAPTAADREITLSPEMLDELPMAQAEPLSVELVLANLLANAIKFSPAQSTILVVGLRDGGQVGLEVQDNGPGVSPEDQEHLGERFFRGTDPGKRRVYGTGLGLYVSRRLLERQRGRLRFTSQPGQGSRFGFLLPVAPAAVSERR